MNEIYLEFYLILKAKVRTTSPSNEPYRGSIFFHLEKKMFKKKEFRRNRPELFFLNSKKKNPSHFPRKTRFRGNETNCEKKEANCQLVKVKKLKQTKKESQSKMATTTLKTDDGKHLQKHNFFFLKRIKKTKFLNGGKPVDTISRRVIFALYIFLTKEKSIQKKSQLESFHFGKRGRNFNSFRRELMRWRWFK